MDWIEYTLSKYFAGRLPLSQCLSLGCGSGYLERRLAGLGAFQHCDAYDVAEGSVQLAKKTAEEEGILNVSYHVTDINNIVLPAGLYDSVWIYSAMHHFEALEHVCLQIRNSLKPGGLLILNEYVGPSRIQFPARQKELINLCRQILPIRYRTPVNEPVKEPAPLESERAPVKKGLGWFISKVINKTGEGDLMGVIRRRLRAYRAKVRGQSAQVGVVRFPSAREVIAADPSEAIRSEEIVGVIQGDFDIIEKNDWGGNLLQFLLSGIVGNFSTEDELSQAVLRMLINIEDVLLECGEFKSDFAHIVARRK
jgi:SAM-dependent methyltransferase